MFYAAQIGHYAVCKELLDRGASVNAQDKFRRTALMCAAENGKVTYIHLHIKILAVMLLPWFLRSKQFHNFGWLLLPVSTEIAVGAYFLNMYVFIHINQVYQSKCVATSIIGEKQTTD